jgi:D-methionine transport system substrate-binding protein
MSTGNTSPEPALPVKPGRGKGFFLGIGSAIVVVVVAIVLVVVFATSGGSPSAGRTTVRLGVTDASEDYWKTFTQLAADEGIDVQLVNFSDYTQADPALSQGQLDLNEFQHILFLANYNVSSNDTLTPVGSTYVVPLGLYSRKHTTLAEIPQGGTVAIPNDPTNQGRALLVLQAAGLVGLREGGNALSTPADIDQASSKIRVTPIDAAQTVTALPSVDASVVNNNFALDGGLDPTSALYKDDPKSPSAQPYINVFVSRAHDKDNPTFQKLVRLYHDPRVSGQVEAQSKNTSVLVDRPGPDLEGILARLEQTVRAAK